MKVLIAIAVVGCLFVANAEKLSDREGYYNEMRPRLGHFRLEPFIQLYEHYATAFVLPHHDERPADNYANYLPTAGFCMTFFQKFHIDNYKLRDLDDFVVLDACLGYLYESEYHEKDKEDNAFVAENLDNWIKDETLKSIYENTKIDEFSDDAKDCIGDLFLEVIRVKKQYSDLTCNNMWIQVFLNFAKCHKSIPAEARETDSYMNIIYELVNIRGRECFLSEIRLMNEAVRGEYVNNPFTHVKNSLSWSSLGKQRAERIWPKEISELLAAFTGVVKPQQVNLRRVNEIVRGISLGKENHRRALLLNMAKYADEHIKRGKKDNAADPTGIQRYSGLVDGLCNFWRSSNNPKAYDFATPLIRMIEMLKYPEIFEIDEKYFVSHVVTHSYESAPIYFSVSACNLLTFTEGQFEHKPHNSKQTYMVVFRPDTSKMVVWPDAGFF